MANYARGLLRDFEFDGPHPLPAPDLFAWANWLQRAAAGLLDDVTFDGDPSFWNDSDDIFGPLGPLS